MEHIDDHLPPLEKRVPHELAGANGDSVIGHVFFLCVACKNEKRDEKMRAKIKRQELIFLAIVFICISDELTCSVSSAKGLTDG